MAKNRYFTYEPKPRKIMNEEKWIATLRQNKMCSLEDIAKEISSRTTIAPGEVEAVLTKTFGHITTILYSITFFV